MAGTNKRNSIATASGDNSSVIDIGDVAELFNDIGKIAVGQGITFSEIKCAVGFGEKKTRRLIHKAIGCGLCTPRKMRTVNIVGQEFSTVVYDFHR